MRFAHHLTHLGAHRLGVLSGCGLPGADGPDRLVGDDGVGGIRRGRQGAGKLVGDDRGGPALARSGRKLAIETLGEHGCVDLTIDLEAAAEASGRDSARRGDTAMVAPDRWLWHPSIVPATLEAQARFALPEGVHATVPWPAIGDGWRRLDHSSFGWNAWVAFGRYEPLEFEVGDCSFEVAILEGARRASDAGIEAWLRAAAETSIELYGRFPRERVGVDAAIETRPDAQGLEFGSKGNPIGIKRITQGLDADAIACEQEPPAAPIPQRECKHATKVMDDIRAPLLVAMDDRFAVALGTKYMPIGLKRPSQLAKVVDLTVGNQPDRTIFIAERLLPGRRVDDRKATVRQRHRALNEQVAAVRSTVNEPLIHGLRDLALGGLSVKQEMA